MNLLCVWTTDKLLFSLIEPYVALLGSKHQLTNWQAFKTLIEQWKSGDAHRSVKKKKNKKEKQRRKIQTHKRFIVQELCVSRGGRPGLSVLTSLLVSVDVKLY